METLIVTLSIAILAPLFSVLLSARANRETPRTASNSMLFPFPGGVSFVDGRAVRVAGVVICFGFAIAALEYREWIVAGLSVFFAIGVAVPWSTSLRIDDAGVHQDGWGPFQRTIGWNDIAVVEFNMGNQIFTVAARNGKKIKHSGHIAGDRFRTEVLRRTKLPLTVATPGLWKVKRKLIPYAELGISSQDEKS